MQNELNNERTKHALSQTAKKNEINQTKKQKMKTKYVLDQAVLMTKK